MIRKTTDTNVITVELMKIKRGAKSLILLPDSIDQLRSLIVCRVVSEGEWKDKLVEIDARSIEQKESDSGTVYVSNEKCILFELTLEDGEVLEPFLGNDQVTIAPAKKIVTT